MRYRFTPILALAFVSAATIQPTFAGDWNRFRGPNGTGIATNLNVPNELSMSNLAWKQELGKGGSSLIASGDKLFLTTYDDENRNLVCLSAKDGSTLWSKSIPKLRKETATPPNDPAMCTPVCDDNVVCAHFPDAGLVVYNHTGELLWKKDVGPFYSMHGISASPILAGDKLLLSIDQLQNPFIAALDIKNGDELWRSERLSGVTGGYSSPVLMQHGDVNLVISAGPGEMAGYDLATGEKRLSLTGLTNAPVGLPIVHENKIYYCEPPGEPIPMEALGPVDKNKDGVLEFEEVKASVGTFRLVERIDKGFGNNDGKVTQDEWEKAFGTFLNSGGLSCVEITNQGKSVEGSVVWKYSKTTPYIASLMLIEDRVYIINDGGILISFDSKSGEVTKRQRLGNATGQYYASPVSDGNRLVLANLDGKLNLVKLGDSWDQLATLDLEEPIVATPSIHDGKLFVRTKTMLYCFGS